MVIPKSLLLRMTLGWMAGSMLWTLILGRIQSADPIQASNAFLLRTFLPYFCGAFGSSFSLLWLFASLLAALLFATILVKQCQSRVWAQVWLGLFVLLSMLVIWFDSWLVVAFFPLISAESAEVLAQESITSSLEWLFDFSVSTIVSAAWPFFWIFTARELDGELYDSIVHRQRKQELNELVSEVLTVEEPVTPVIVTPVISEVRCLACQSSMSSTNRFCTRSGAPLQLPRRVKEGD